jgi:argininosuccinate lyase
MKKLWGGRFSGSRDTFADEFGASIHFDKRLAPYDIQGSIAHVTMLGETGIIKLEEARQIVHGLERVRGKLDRGEIDFRISDEDIHMNIERHLTEEIGEVAGKLHTARSRNDQVALDFHLFIRESLVDVSNLLLSLQEALLTQAETQRGVIMPGYTHLQRAQPILFSHHLLAYVQMFSRDCERLQDLWKRVNVLPLGAGALAGTTFPIDRARVAALLNFDGVYENSMDAVSDRDFVLEFLSASALIMMHLSRLCEEIFLWSSGEFGFIELDDSLSTGSSMMPQKKNPDFAELVRGKTGRVYGSLVSLLTTMKGLPLAYNKDMQEDKEGTFDAVDTVLGSLTVVAAMVRSWKVSATRMRSAAEQGFTNATDAADYLAARGVPFREAHEVVGKLVRHCVEHAKALLELSLEDFKRFSPVFEEDVFQSLALETVVGRRMARGGTAGSSVEKQIELAKQHMREKEAWCTEMLQRVGVTQ